MNSPEHGEIALALSGGGTRAVLFHLGVLSCLAEKNLLERVRYVSSVSGGTLLVGLVFHHNRLQWPTDRHFLDVVAPAVRSTISRGDLQLSALARLAWPWNWRYLPFRANVLAETLRVDWGINARLEDLPPSPVWAINATSMESGRRWRFRAGETGALGQRSMGDGALGYAFDQAFSLAEAMATSAAFPGGLSPLVLRTDRCKWFLREFGDASGAPRPVAPKFPKYHLADGGVYDNLGLEPLFDAGAGRLRSESRCNYIIASDAGAPLDVRRWTWFSQLAGFAKRTIDIMGAQQRNLRVRTLVTAFVEGTARGVFINIAEPARVAIERALRSRTAQATKLQGYRWLTAEQAQACASYATTLRTPKEQYRELIERHGYETAKAQLELWAEETTP